MLENANLLIPTPYKLTRAQLLYDLYVAFEDAARGKHKMSYVKKFEEHLAENLNALCDELLGRTYQALPSKCFIVSYPKKREVFAAMFRDRVVHHLYFRYTHQIFERTFIADTYSCIVGRGTLYGVERLRHHIRQASLNWQEECYAMSLDIRGYFMHIDRARLLKIATESLKKMSGHKVGFADDVPLPSGVLLTERTTWGEVRDFDFLLWLTEQIVMLDPMENCVIVGNPSDWDGLDPAKSMRNLQPGLGLPIGNLTSQLFSNVYLNVFDQFMKRELKCRYYGRYVDDAAVVSADRDWLLSIVPDVDMFLRSELGLELHKGKLEVSEVHRGVEFLGAYIKPWRTYISNHSLRRMEKKIADFDYSKPWLVVRSVNSYLGIFQHTSSYRLRRRLFMTRPILRICTFDERILKVV